MAAAQARYYAAYQQAIGHPGTSASTAPLLALYVPGSTARQQIQARLAGLKKLGYAGQPGKSGYYILESVAVDGGSPAERATATVCTYDDGVIFDATHKAPDGSHIVVDDSVESDVTTFTWVLSKGAWLLDGDTTVTSWKGTNRCPPRR